MAATNTNQSLVAKLYKSVIEDVITGVRGQFLDEGVDEAVLEELKQIWEGKLAATRAIEPVVDPAEANLQSKVTSQGNAAPEAPPQPAQPPAAPAATTAASTPAAPASNATTTTTAARLVPVQITVPAQAGVPGSTAKQLTVQVPAHALQGGSAGAQLQSVLSSPAVTRALSFPAEVAANIIQHHINTALQVGGARPQGAAPAGNTTDNGVTQLDGANDSSDDDDDVEDDDDDIDDVEDDKEDYDQEDDNEETQEEDPLNSGDDLSDEDPTELFETDNVVVCQYDKITRSRNRWKFHLKDGIMTINGRDYVFQKATGDAEW